MFFSKNASKNSVASKLWSAERGRRTSLILEYSTIKGQITTGSHRCHPGPLGDWSISTPVSGQYLALRWPSVHAAGVVCADRAARMR